MIKHHEGQKLESYYDSEDNLTIGYGHKVLPSDVDINGDPIVNEKQKVSQEQMDAWFMEDLAKAQQSASKIAGFEYMSDDRRNAMIDLTFNMGFGWTEKFPKAYGYITEASRTQDPENRRILFFKASEELRYRDADDKSLGNSKYWNQTGRRAPFITSLVEGPR